MPEAGREIPIRTLPFSEMNALKPHAKGWVYPRRNISPFLPLFTKAQRAAINFYGWSAIMLVPAGISLALFMNNWWWLLLVPVSLQLWKANRQSMEQFFVDNLSTDEKFYGAAQARLGDYIKIVI